MGDTIMNDVILTSAMLKLGMAVVAIFFTWGSLRILDVLLSFDFRRWLNAECNDDLAVALYLGARFVGACILVGLLFS